MQATKYRLNTAGYLTNLPIDWNYLWYSTAWLISPSKRKDARGQDKDQRAGLV